MLVRIPEDRARQENPDALASRHAKAFIKPYQGRIALFHEQLARLQALARRGDDTQAAAAELQKMATKVITELDEARSKLNDPIVEQHTVTRDLRKSLMQLVDNALRLQA